MSKFAGNSSSGEMHEIYLDSLGADYGEFVLGRNTTKILHEDPKGLLFTLARYKFAAKMLAGCENVLEIGCQEGFGAVLVSSSVEHLLGIDFFLPYIESCERRISNPRLRFEAHDILDGPVPGNFDGIFSLDVLEHIRESDEHLFMQNAVRSLDPKGTMIIGMPSLESQAYASEASRIGHVNCKTGEAMRTLALQFFHKVYSFSMNDEVLHTGFFPMSHYLLVVCSDPRTDL